MGLQERKEKKQKRDTEGKEEVEVEFEERGNAQNEKIIQHFLILKNRVTTRDGEMTKMPLV